MNRTDMDMVKFLIFVAVRAIYSTAVAVIIINALFVCMPWIAGLPSFLSTIVQVIGLIVILAFIALSAIVLGAIEKLYK